MKKRFGLLLLIVLTLFAGTLRADEKKCLLVMLDGTRADALLSASTPNIDSVRLGTWAPGYQSAYSFEAYTSLDAPPSSATNHVAILTGVTATKNGCYNNGQTASAKYGLHVSAGCPPLRRLRPWPRFLRRAGNVKQSAQGQAAAAFHYIAF